MESFSRSSLLHEFTIKDITLYYIVYKNIISSISYISIKILYEMLETNKLISVRKYIDLNSTGVNLHSKYRTIFHHWERNFSLKNLPLTMINWFINYSPLSTLSHLPPGVKLCAYKSKEFNNAFYIEVPKYIFTGWQ